MRVTFTGGIPLRSLRMAGEDGGLETPVYNTLQDTWPLDDLLHDIFSREFETEYDVLACALQGLTHSKTASALLHDVAPQGWEMGLSDLNESAFHLDVPAKKIIMNSNGLAPAAFVRVPGAVENLQVTVLRALRDAWHEKRHGGFDEKFTAESVLMLERVRAADCDVIAVLAAWELRSAGHGDAWRHILASDEGDIAVAFGCALENAGNNYPVHRALLAGFNQWYAAPRRAQLCDHETLEYIDEVIRCGAGFGKIRAGAVDVEVLSCLPDRTAYLQGEGENILRAPIYAGLHDEVNQSHYMQVVHDLSVTYVQGVPFCDASLAAKIFPGGEMTPEAQANFQDN